jgi:hypothetical protein
MKLMRETLNASLELFETILNKILNKTTFCTAEREV